MNLRYRKTQLGIHSRYNHPMVVMLLHPKSNSGRRHKEQWVMKDLQSHSRSQECTDYTGRSYSDTLSYQMYPLDRGIAMGAQ